jgi:hypothetical protein
VLNTNARGVDKDLVETVQRVIENNTQQKKDDNNNNNNNNTNNHHRIYVTSTKEDARQAAQELIARPPTIVIPVGGDGTLTTLLQFLWDAQQNDTDTNTDTPSMKRMPTFAYIAMGTGNALGPVVGCTPRQRTKSHWKKWNLLRPKRRKLQKLEQVLTELLQVCNQLEQPDEEASSPSNDSDIDIDIDIVDLPLLLVTSTLTTDTTDTTTDTNKEKEEQATNGALPSSSPQPPRSTSSSSASSLCFFAGVGFDSLMLQDYQELQEWTAKRKNKVWFKDQLSSVLGYCVALVTRTLPKCVQRNEHLIQVALSTNQPESTVWVDHRRGDVVRSVVAVPEEDKKNTEKTKKKEDPNHNNKDNSNNNKSKTSTLLYQGQAGICLRSGLKDRQDLDSYQRDIGSS